MAWLPQRLLLPPSAAAAAAARGGSVAADALPRAAAVFGGLASSACTDASGHVYTWGLGGTHQLGHGGPQDEWSPRLVRKDGAWRAAMSCAAMCAFSSIPFVIRVSLKAGRRVRPNWRILVSSCLAVLLAHATTVSTTSPVAFRT